MTKVYETYSMDYTSRNEHAQNKDGIWFRRSQYRDPRYGYKWTKWARTAVAPDKSGGQDRNIRLPRI